MPAWRDWLLGDRGLGPRKAAVVQAADAWERAGARSQTTLPRLKEVEETALKVYADAGFPTRPGHYRRGPGEETWTWIAQDLPAEARWQMILDYPPEQGWRYATLDDLGRFPGASAELLGAAGLLRKCRHLTDRLWGRVPGDPGTDIEMAVSLGADWKALQDALAWRETTRLKLTTPSDALAAPEDKPPRKPRKPRALKPPAS